MNEEIPHDQAPVIKRGVAARDYHTSSLPLASSGKRSIDPLPAAVQEGETTEASADPAETASESTDTEAATASPEPVTPDPYPDRPEVDIKAIYPDNTPKFTDGVYQKPGEPAADSEPEVNIKQRNKTTRSIAIFGALIIVDALVSLVFLLHFKVPHSSVFTPVDLLITIVSIALGVGILARKEVARLIYLAFSALVIIISVSNIYLYSNAKLVESQNTKNFLAQEQQLESQYQDSKTLTAAQKSELIGQIKTQEQVLPHPQKNTHLLYTPLAELIMPLAAIIFLVLPTVEEQFSSAGSASRVRR